MDIRMIASKGSWIEGKAIEQLQKAAQLQQMLFVVGLPDLHAGKGFPVGAAMVSKKLFYPCLAGNDIGCAMSFWQTNLQINKTKISKLVSKVKDLESKYAGDISYLVDKHDLPDSPHNLSLGTIGGGNHFAELQEIHQVTDIELFESLSLNKNNYFMLIHSGSRSLGEEIFNELLATTGLEGIDEKSQTAEDYLYKYNHATRWAKANRELIAQRFAYSLGTKINLISDVLHNSITKEIFGDELLWVHRKGAAHSNLGPVVVPGSRGTFSYLVSQIGDHSYNAYSIAHGAGRKWDRASAKGKLKKFSTKELEKTPLGGQVICRNKDLIYEEAPQAYKNIDQVIKDLKDAGLIKVIAILKPVLTYKTQRSSNE